MKHIEIDSIVKLNNRTSPFLIEEGDIYDSQNIDTTRKIGSARKEGDYAIVGARIAAGRNVLGLGEYERDSESNELYSVVDGASNSDIYKWNGSSWAAQSQSLTAAATGRFASIPELDLLFFVNYSDATRSYNGSAWSTSTSVTSAPKAKFVAPHEARLFLLNTVVASTAYPARYYFSSSAIEGALTWDTTNDFNILPGPGTGLVVNGENLLAFTKKSIHMIDAYERREIARVGTEASDTIRTWGKWTLFANETGAFATDGATTEEISGPVKEYWQGITKSFVPSMSAAVKNGIWYLFLGDITVPSTQTNVMLAYDIVQNKWDKYQIGENITQMVSHTDSNKSTDIYMGNDDGEIWKFLSGTGQNSLDYTSYVETHYIFADNQVNEWLDIEVWGKNMSGLQAWYKTDDEQRWSAVGSGEELRGDYTQLRFKATGEKIKFKFIETGRGTNWELYKYRVGYRNLHGATE